MNYEVSHKTEFVYEQVVLISHHVLHLSPRSFGRQTCGRCDIAVSPPAAALTEHEDYFGNLVGHLLLDEPHDRLVVEVRSQVAVEPVDSISLESTPTWETVAAAVDRPPDETALEASKYAYASPYITTGVKVRDLGADIFLPGRPVLDAAMALTTKIFREFTYQGGVTDVSTPVETVLATRRGVCQDFAHLQIACLRSMGLAARYVSGYLLTHPPEGRPRLQGADASHAWVSVWCPEFGWIDFDPTNDLLPSEEHITLAWGRDYGDVSPINGLIVGGGAHQIKVGVDVSPVSRA